MSGCSRLDLPNPFVTFCCSGLSIACYDPRLRRVHVCFHQVRYEDAPPLGPPSCELAEQCRGLWRPAHIARWRNRTSTVPQGKLVQREQEVFITGKSTFLLVFCASAIPASGKLKERQLDIWEVLTLGSQCGAWDVCGRWSKNDCKSQWIQQKWPQCTTIPPPPTPPVRVIAFIDGAINRRAKSRPPFSRYGDNHAETAGFSLQKPAPASKWYIVYVNSTHDNEKRFAFIWLGWDVTDNQLLKVICMG